MTSPEQEPIDTRNNPESRSTESSASPPLSRGGSASVVPAEQAPPMPEPTGDTGGTAEGDPLGGVGMTEEDREDTVRGKAGPEPTALGQN